jgi:hypothetical protein
MATNFCKVISFDIGIKNMAYCILSNENNVLSILDWNVINLMDDEEPTSICQCQLKQKSKKQEAKPCSTKAKYQKDGKYFCEKHAKASSCYLIPNKKNSTSNLKKMKVDELFKLAQSYLLFGNIENPSKLNKSQVLDLLTVFFKTQSFEMIIKQAKVSANDTDLISIGKNLKDKLNQVLEINNITHVVIENQISPIANRMKTIQGMLAQYFIIKNDSIFIEFVSSSNKLKQFQTKKEDNSTSLVRVIENTIVIDTSNNKINKNYKQHKLDGVHYCSQFIEKNENLSMWKDSLTGKKQDDLADSFLQGIWYLRSRKLLDIQL